MPKLADYFPDITAKLIELDELPPISEIAEALLQLKSDPQADAKRLGQLIEMDPSLAVQIMRYAGSAYFGYRGNIDSIQNAVSRVLGFDKAMHIAIGIASGKSLSHNKEGPLGIKSFWHSAIYSATLMQALANKLPSQSRPSLGLVYLAGLVHNIGFLLLGHLFERDFNVLNSTIEENPERSIIEVEQELLGITHCDLGVVLLRKWQMPPEILAVVMSHHNECYQGDYAVYTNLALISDRLLKRHGIGDGCNESLPDKNLNLLGLSSSVSEEALSELMGNAEGLDALVQNAVVAA